MDNYAKCNCTQGKIKSEPKLTQPSLGFIIQIFNIITIHQILERQGTDYPSHDIPESLSQTES